MYSDFTQKLSKIDSTTEAKTWTHLGVGGKPIFTFFPVDIDQLYFFLKHKPKDLKYRTFGAGSNILIRDNGYDGVFIRLNRTFRKIKIENSVLIAEAGVNFTQLTQFCLINEVGGLEFLCTIPGQVGGLTKMNAGLPEIEMKDIVKWVEFINEFGEEVRLKTSECDFKYRSSIFKNNWIITKVAFKMEQKRREEIQKSINKFKEYRKISQPIIGKMAGCFFKNPELQKAWQIIQNTNIKGCGKTCVSNIHSNFIMANDSSNAKEIEYLLEAIRASALFNQRIFLESEIEKIGII